MADGTHGFSDTQKFCLEYYERNTCKKLGCMFIHKRKANIDVVQVKTREGFVVGRCGSIPLCRYFLRGYCTHAGNCRFRHEIRPVNKMNVPNTTSNQLLCTNVPSTSATELRLEESNDPMEEDAPMDDNSDDDAANACALINTNNRELESVTASGSSLKDSSWVNAPEFVPKTKSATANTLNNGVYRRVTYAAAVDPQSGKLDPTKALCPYSNKDGFCKYPPGECAYVHGEICDMCGNAQLHPFDEDLRKLHRQECIKQHEKNMELSFAIARSKEKTCGICFEIIMEKANGEQRFGILPNCNHCFCLCCIRKWRQARQFENKIIRACPECRVTSDFVCPSIFWVDTKDDKNKLIDDYKSALSTKDCKYFDKGVGKCPFGNKCFYRHALPDGQVCDVGPPPRQRRNRTTTLDPSAIQVLQQVILFDFLDERYNLWPTIEEDLEDLAQFFSDSDESDWSDYMDYLN